MNRDISNSFDYDSAIILGAGPIGLWSAIQMLENNFAKNVTLLEKRFSFNPALNRWADRAMVVQFHRSLLPIANNKQPVEICPYHVLKMKNEGHRIKYADLDHMSIKSIQSTLMEYLLAHYPENFMMVEMQKMFLERDLPVIRLGVGSNDITSFSEKFRPDFLLDATGYHSNFMHQMLGINFECATEYGSALKITWPEHEMINVSDKETEFHDCHYNSHFFKEGYSSVAEFSSPIPGICEFLRECGYNHQDSEKNLPFLKYDDTPFSIKLAPFLQKIMESKTNQHTYGKAVSLFKRMRGGNLRGIDGFDFIKRLQFFDWREAEVLALTVRQIVNKNISIENVFSDLASDNFNLKKMEIVFVPSRIERWLVNNEKQTRVKLEISNYLGQKLNLCSEVTACAVGDSLSSTDFRHGLGINRGLHTATRLFRDKISPELARVELIENGYFRLDEENDKKIFNRAVSCRDWMLMTSD